LFFKHCCKQDVDGRDNKPGHDGWMGHCDAAGISRARPAQQN
jgi:hypothetical protein